MSIRRLSADLSPQAGGGVSAPLLRLPVVVPALSDPLSLPSRARALFVILPAASSVCRLAKTNSRVLLNDIPMEQTVHNSLAPTGNLSSSRPLLDCLLLMSSR